MENSTETNFLSPEADKALKQIMPLLNGLSFIEIKEVIETIWEQVEKNSVLTMPIASKEPENKPTTPKSEGGTMDAIVAEFRQKMKDAGIEGELTVHRIPKSASFIADLIEHMQKDLQKNDRRRPWMGQNL